MYSRFWHSVHSSTHFRLLAKGLRPNHEVRVWYVYNKHRYVYRGRMCLFYPYFHRCASCAYYLTQCRIVYTSKHCEVHIPVERPISFFRRRNGVGISYRNGQAMEWSPRCQIEFFLRIVSTDPFDCLTDSGVILFFENPALSWLRIIHEVERERLRWKKSLSAILKSATSGAVELTAPALGAYIWNNDSS